MNGRSEYEVVLDTVPSGRGRPEVVFRRAGDGFIQVEYWRNPRFSIVESFRIQLINSLMNEGPCKGFIESVPALRTNLVHYDPCATSGAKIVAWVRELELGVGSIEDVAFPSRRIVLPIAFGDSRTRQAVERYCNEVRKDAPNVIQGHNLEFVARYNGCSVADVERMVVETEWYNSGNGFTPGSGLFWPLDPRCAINVPKYSPPRTWTPAGAVGIGGACLSAYPSETGGGYQLIGRTIPMVQFAREHPAFVENPCFFRAGDRVKFRRCSEEELDSAIAHVHKEPFDYVFEVDEQPFRVGEYLAFCAQEDVERGAERLRALQASGAAAMPIA